MTIGSLYKNFTEQLKNIYGPGEAANITDWVFENIAGIKRLERVTDKDKPFSLSLLEQLNNSLQELLMHKPVQYVLGEAWFCKMKFFVNDKVLIPRPETEELVEWLISDVHIKKQKLSIIDIGTGSGCIAIALKKQLPAATIIALDISTGALSVARQNASALSAAIEFLTFNFLDETAWDQLGFFDVIISNPPYIPAGDKSSMNKNVIDYEPHLALFPEDPDPFIFYKKIALFSRQHFSEGGKLYVEVHEGNANMVSDIFEKEGFTCTKKKDIYGRDRMVRAQRPLT